MMDGSGNYLPAEEEQAPADPAALAAARREAFAALKSAAEGGDADAQARMGEVCYKGNFADCGQERDWAASVRWYRAAAEQGHLKAQKVVAAAYWLGQGVEADAAEALRWYEAAAEQGDADALFALAQMAFQGKGMDEDWERSFAYLRRAADATLQSGAKDSTILSTLAVYYDNGIGTDEDKKAALTCAQQALQGDKPTPKAFFLMGQYYAEGQGGLEQDDAKALSYYRAAAIEGDKEAQCNLGSAYAMGRGCEPDMQRALVWFRASAAQGCAMAMVNLGRCFMLGDGVERDEAAARRYFEQAVQRGSKEAVQYLQILDGEFADEAAAE